MKNTLSIIILLLMLSFTLIADEKTDSAQKVYEKYLKDGELITVERTKNAATSPYEYTFKLFYKEDEDRINIMTKYILHTDVKEGFDVNKALIIHDVARNDKHLYILYTLKTKINFEWFIQDDQGWKSASSAEISTELAQPGVDSGSIFAVGTGNQVFVFLEGLNKNKEYWQIIIDTPKLLWSSKNEESRSTNTYDEWLKYVKKRADEETERLSKLRAKIEQEKNANSNDNKDGINQVDETTDKTDENDNSSTVDKSDTQSNTDPSEDLKTDDTADEMKSENDNNLSSDVDENNLDNKSSNTNKVNSSESNGIFTYVGIAAGIVVLFSIVFFIFTRKRY